MSNRKKHTSKNKKTQANKRELNSFEARKKEIKEQHDLEKLEKDYKAIAFVESRKRVISYVVNGILIALFAILCLAVLAGFIFLVWWIIAYFSGNEFADRVSVIMQMIASTVSVGVGIWALVLTIKSYRGEKGRQNQLNITRSFSDNNITPKFEDDVNPSTFQ